MQHVPHSLAGLREYDLVGQVQFVAYAAKHVEREV